MLEGKSELLVVVPVGCSVVVGARRARSVDERFAAASCNAGFSEELISRSKPLLALRTAGA